ncbi:succinate--CoA ligase subunit alpha [Candidatus Bipolaricaulota bacterium]|nr:succinate--CoA ligase subunit alpha [Candidatus Bipolaricaulota bacterium]
MSILVDENTQVLVQGITGSEGAFHTRQMVAYGTKVVAGVTPGKGGTTLDGIPVYDSVAEAAAAHRLDASVLFVPAAFAPEALLEAAAAGIPLLVCITEGIALHAMLRTYHLLRAYPVRLIGPNCPGVISPGRAKVGVIPAAAFTPGPVGVLSRSGTLTYEIASHLSQAGIGQSTVVGIGGDPIIGSSFVDLLPLFEADPETEAVVLVGEIGGAAEDEAAQWWAENGVKPLVAYIAGFSAPPGKRMGHAGAIVTGGEDTAQAKAERLERAGISVARTPAEVARLIQEALR